MLNSQYIQNILSNRELLKLCYEAQNKLFYSCLTYSLRIYYLEEIFNYTHCNFNTRYILDLENFSILKSVNDISHWKDNPFNSTTMRDNIGCSLFLPYYIKGQRGIYPIQQFKARLNIFMKEAFNYPDFPFKFTFNATLIRVVLCGSTITACLCKNPLEEYYTTLEEYFDAYYPTETNYYYSNDDTILEKYYDTEEPDIKKEKEKEYINISDDFDDDDDDSSHYAEEVEISEDSKKNRFYADVDIMVETIDSKDIIMPYFDEAVKRIYNYFKIGNKNIELVRENTENKYKYRILGLYRRIDIFQVNSIPKVIVKFHLSCVRAWYDGENIYGFPSFLTAAMTGINMDIRWISCNKDLRDLIMKYFQRGYGTLLNKNDKESMIDYINKREDIPKIGFNGRHRAIPEYMVSKFNRRPLYGFPEKSQQIFNPIRTSLKICLFKHLNDQMIGTYEYRKMGTEQVVAPHRNQNIKQYII